MSDEEDINFFKISSNHPNSDGISALNENSSTYMGVKTLPEGTIPDTNETNEKNKKHKNKKSKKNNKKKRKTDSFSSYSSSSINSSSWSLSSRSSSFSDSDHSSNISYNSSSEKKNKKKKKKGKKEKKEHNKGKNKNKKDNNENNEPNKENKKNDVENIKMKKENEVKTNEIDTMFEWDEGGNVVFVTGSFCDWSKFFLLKKNDEGKYSVTLPLPRGFHQYKFKVDDNWTYSKKQPKYEDNGNVNNFIDTTDYDNLDEERNDELNNTNEQLFKEENEINKEKSNESIKLKGENKEKSKEKIKEKVKEKKKKKNIENKISEIKRNSSSHNVHFLNNQNDYAIYYPLRAEFNKKPSALPGLYKTYYILNEKKNKKQVERKFSQIEYIDSTNNSIQDNYSEMSQNQSFNKSFYFMNDINPYVKFQNLYHIHSNHLHSKEAIYVKTSVTSIISRYRSKFSTFIYYKENKSKFEFDKMKHSKTVKIKRGKHEKNNNNKE